MMAINFPLDITPLLALYPEIHYRLRAFPFSRYFRRYPEMIADAPFRLEPGASLPLLLLIKDADRFPITLQEIAIVARTGNIEVKRVVSCQPERIKRRWWHLITHVALPDHAPCIWAVDIYFYGDIHGGRFTVKNDNLPGLSHRSLQVYQSKFPLPKKSGWHYGDLHAHTVYTEDQVEFGAPLSAYPELGAAAGLSFMLAADHSYDLDDVPGSFSRRDPDMVRYQYRRAECERLNQEYRGGFAMLPGIELSVGNAHRKNVHLLLVNQDEFLPGSGDSAERWFHTRPEFGLPETLRRKSPTALAVAAHPLMKPPFLQRLFLGRDFWHKADFEEDGLAGLQIWNGRTGAGFHAGLKVWVDGLLQGKRWKIFAGSDAHGNFNRYRQISVPMLTLRESAEYTFGEVRTGVFIKGELGTDTLCEALQNGRSFVTDGPWINLDITTGAADHGNVRLQGITTEEFGAFTDLKLFWGKTGNREEEVIAVPLSADRENVDHSIWVKKPGGYLRLEARTEKGKAAYSNPLFLNDPER